MCPNFRSRLSVSLSSSCSEKEIRDVETPEIPSNSLDDEINSEVRTPMATDDPEETSSIRVPTISGLKRSLLGHLLARCIVAAYGRGFCLDTNSSTSLNAAEISCCAFSLVSRSTILSLDVRTSERRDAAPLRISDCTALHFRFFA